MSVWRDRSDHDPYEGVSEDPWAPPPSLHRDPENSWLDADEPPEELAALESAEELAEELTAAGVASITPEQLVRLFDRRDSIVDLDQTRYLSDPPHHAVVLDLPGVDEVLVVTVVPTSESRIGAASQPSWIVTTWEEYTAQASQSARIRAIDHGASPGTAVGRGAGSAPGGPTTDHGVGGVVPAATQSHGSPLRSDEVRLVQARGPWFDLAAAAGYLGVEPDDLVHWQGLGLIGTQLLPDGRTRFAASDLDGLLAAERPTPTVTEVPPSSRTVPEPEREVHGFDVFDLGAREGRVRTFTIDDCPARIHSYLYVDESAIEVTLEVVRAHGGEAWVRAAQVGDSLRGLGRLLHGGRLGIRRWGHLETAELAQMQFTDFPWSGLRMVGQEELHEGAGVDVTEMLMAQGATRVGRRADLEACTNQRRNYLAVQFEPGDDEVPALAYVLTRIVPLIRAERARTPQ